MGEVSAGTSPTIRPPEDRLDSWKEIATYLNRDVTTVQRWEKREGMPVHRHLHDRMGSVYAFPRRVGRMGAQPEYSRQLKTMGTRLLRINHSALPPRHRLPSRWRFVLPVAAVVALAMGATLWFQKTEYFWRNPIADARFQTVTDFDGVEQAAAVSRDGHFVAFLVGPGRTDGRLGYAGRFRAVPQLDPRQRTGTRQSFGPHPGVLARWFSGHLLGSQARWFERRRYQYLGSAHAWRAAEALPGRRRRIRLVARRFPARVPHARTRRSAVCVRRRPSIRGSADLHCARRAALSLSVVGARLGIHLLRPGFAA